MSKVNRTSAVVWIVVVIVMSVLLPSKTNVRAQDNESSPAPTPPPKSAEVLRLEEEKAQAELRKAIAEANKAELEARFPKPTTSPLAGTTTVEGAVIESQMVSYAHMSIAANKLVTRLQDVTPKINSLVIYNDKDVNLILSYKVALNQAELITQGYNTLLEPSPTACPAPCIEVAPVESLGRRSITAMTGPVPLLTIAQSLFGSFVDLTALLRTNVEIKGQTFDIDEVALVSEVFRAAHAEDGLPGVPLFYPSMFPPNLDFTVGQMTSPLLSKIDALNEVKAYADGLANALEENQKNTKKTEATIENLKADVEGLTARKEEAEAKLADLEKIYGSSDNPRMRRRIPREKLEVMLELKRKIANLQEQLDQIQQPHDGKLAKAQRQLGQLNGELRWLLSRLKPELRNPDKIQETVAKLRAKNEQFANFVQALVKADQASGLNSLTSYIKAETMLSALKGEDGKNTNFYWLQLKVLKAGGNNRIKTNLVVDIFTGGNRLSHSGGAVVEYILFDRNGKSVASDVLTEYSGYIKADKVKTLKNPAKVGETLGK